MIGASMIDPDNIESYCKAFHMYNISAFSYTLQTRILEQKVTTYAIIFQIICLVQVKIILSFSLNLFTTPLSIYMCATD